jgi:signal transduction histidine kinase
MILLADANPERLKLFHSWLSPYYHVRLAQSADEAVHKATELHPGLILADDSLVNESGQDLLELIRRNPATHLLPLILISNEPVSPAPHEDFESGADDALIEPFTQSEMLARVRTQLRMTQVRDRLVRQREGLRLRDEFLQVASHELKTPVASLQLQLQLLKRQAKRVGDRVVPMETFIHELDGALKQTSVLTHLINDLLEVSRIQSGQLAVEPHVDSLSLAIREVISRYAELIHEAGCNYSLEIQDAIAANFDAARIEQVLVNLISNSCKYAPGSHIHISLREAGGFAELRFTDDGPGIPQAHVDAIFDRFSRGSSGNNVSGLGLGLYIVKGIVEAHQGTIKLRSSESYGTEFTIGIPSVPQEGLSVEDRVQA